MSALQHLTWVAVPRRLYELEQDGPTVWFPSFTAFLIPTLTPAGTTSLDRFADLADWPARRPTSFVATIDGVDRETAPISIYGEDFAPNRDVWRSVFPGDMKVRPATGGRDLRAHEHVCGDVAQVEQGLVAIYGALARSVAEHSPTVAQLLSVDLLSSLVDTRRLSVPPSRRVAPRGGGPTTWAVGPPPSNLQALIDLQALNAAASASDDGPPDLEPPDLDFHDHVSVLAAHAPLLRLLGLATDLVVAQDPEVEDNVEFALSVRPDGWESATRGGSTSVSPKTMCVLDRTHDRLWAVPDPALDRLGGGDAQDGFLRLGDQTRFTVSTLDPDGSVGKLTSFASALTTLSADDDAVLPALRTAGLVVARNDRARVSADAADRQHRFNEAMTTSDGPLVHQGDEVVLYAEDLRRGVRLDVRFGEGRTAGPWLPLQARVGAYVLPGEQSRIPVPPGVGRDPIDPGAAGSWDDEAVLTAAATLRRGEDDPLVRLPADLATYSGWSLAVPRPGKWIGPDEQVVDGSALPDPNAPDGDAGIAFRYRASPGTLPPLRTGRQYQVRARVVDLAGSSVPPTDDSDGPDIVSPTVTYGRFEPLLPPEVLLAAPRTPGESPDLVVIRSEGDGIDPSQLAVRHLVPGSVDQMRAEQDGAFDVAIEPSGAMLSPAVYDEIKERDRRSLSGDPPGDRIANPEARPEGGPFGRGSDLPGSYWYEADGADGLLAVDWLPDVLARGISVRPAGRAAGDTEHIVLRTRPPGGDWRSTHALRMHVMPMAVDPGFAVVRVDGAPPVFEVRVAEGCHADLLVSSTLGSVGPGGEDPLALDTLERMSLWHVLQAAEVPEDLQASLEEGLPALLTLREAILTGAHEAFTPSRRVRVVHATRRPVTAPVIGGPPTFARQPGATTAEVVVRGTVHGQSTASVDVLATRRDLIDDGPGSGARRATTVVDEYVATHVVQATESSLLIDVRAAHDGFTHELGTTRRQLVDYRWRATSAYVEHFTQTLTDVNLAQVGASVPLLADDGSRKGVVPSSVKVVGRPRGDGTVGQRFVLGTDFTIEPDPDGDPSAPPSLLVAKRSMGDGATVSYVVPPVTRDSAPIPPGDEPYIGRADLPATVRPLPPEVDFVVPLFEWSDDDSTNHHSSTRSAYGLRVYLKRPLGTSGTGELVGVCVWHPDLAGTVHPSGEVVQALAMVTEVAGDAVYGTDRAGVQRPGLDDVPSATEVFSGVRPPGMTSITVDVAGHEPVFVETEDRYYVNVRLSPGTAYFPFVRLGLCNVQPRSVHVNPIGIRPAMSSIVTCDFTRLAPDRTATITRSSASTVDVTLSGYGYDHLRVPIGGLLHEPLDQLMERPAVVVAHFERRDPAIDDPDVGWAPVPNTMTRADTFVRSVGEDGRSTWRASGIDLPDSDDDLRLVVEEFEMLPTDATISHVQVEGQPRPPRLIQSELDQLLGLLNGDPVINPVTDLTRLVLDAAQGLLAEVVDLASGAVTGLLQLGNEVLMDLDILRGPGGALQVVPAAQARTFAAASPHQVAAALPSGGEPYVVTGEVDPKTTYFGTITWAKRLVHQDLLPIPGFGPVLR